MHVRLNAKDKKRSRDIELLKDVPVLPLTSNPMLVILNLMLQVHENLTIDAPSGSTGFFTL